MDNLQGTSSELDLIMMLNEEKREVLLEQWRQARHSFSNREGTYVFWAVVTLFFALALYTFDLWLGS